MRAIQQFQVNLAVAEKIHQSKALEQQFPKICD